MMMGNALSLFLKKCIECFVHDMNALSVERVNCRVAGPPVGAHVVEDAVVGSRGGVRDAGQDPRRGADSRVRAAD